MVCKSYKLFLRVKMVSAVKLVMDKLDDIQSLLSINTDLNIAVCIGVMKKPLFYCL